MKAKWSVNPNIQELDKFVALTERYGAAFEYIEFTLPSLYQDPETFRKYVETYKSLKRDTSRDTLHGVFYDVAFLSMDDVIRERSRALARMSLDTARELGCKGVVFHTGILGGLNLPVYLDGWVSGMCKYMPELLESYPDLEIYLENTVETAPKEICEVAKEMSGYKNFGLCLDYAHAVIARTPAKVWADAMAPYVRHMHVNDNDLKDDLHLAAGDGKIDFKKFKKQVEAYGFDTQILLEVSGYEKAEKSLRFMSEL